MLLGTFFLPHPLLLFLALSFTTDPRPVRTVLDCLCLLEVPFVLLLGVCFMCAYILVFWVVVVYFLLLTP